MNTRISWDAIDRDALLLADKVRAGEFVPDVLIGIASGGLVPLALLAKQFPSAKVATIATKRYEGRDEREIEVGGLPDLDLTDKKVLLVDEIVDHGGTLQSVTEALRAKYAIGELRSAVLFVNTINCKAYPDFYVEEIEDWVIFPWEKE